MFFLRKGMVFMAINRDLKKIGEVQDRGKLKWTALMLPEHVRMLRDWMDEDNRIQRPELNEFDLQTLQENIEIALMRKCEVEIQVWKEFKLYYCTGKIVELDLRNRTIMYDDSLSIRRLQVADITVHFVPAMLVDVYFLHQIPLFKRKFHQFFFLALEGTFLFIFCRAYTAVYQGLFLHSASPA